MEPMIRPVLATILIGACLNACARSTPAELHAGANEKINVRVLYAGVLDDPRTTEFVGFLEQHFVSVGRTSYSDFTPKDADGYDVVVFDAEPKPTINTIGLPRAPNLPSDYDRASILVGGAGVLATMPLKLKLDWLCMCLAKEAHGVAQQHEIFRSPLPVDIRYQTIPLPDPYKRPGAKETEDTLNVWSVNTKDYRDKDVRMKPGVVSSGAGFLDSPDTEIISGGVNMKSQDAVAIGRQGPFLLWGFAASPQYMTPSGRNAFVNAVIYIAKFDRRPVLVRKTAHSREDAFRWVELLVNIRKYYQEECEYISSANAKRKELIEAEKIRKLTDEEKVSARAPERPLPTFEEYRKSETLESFPDELVETLGYAPEKYSAYYRENLPYLNYKHYRFVLDEDVKAVAIPNNDPRLIEHCIVNLEKGDDMDRSGRLLERYTGEQFATAVEWRSWFDASRADLFFSDVGGFRFYSKADPTDTIRRRLLARAALVPMESSPVVIQAEITPPMAKPGDVVTLAIRMRIARGWHVYATVPAGNSPQATELHLDTPTGMTAEESWLNPPAKPFQSGVSIYVGDVVFQRKLRIGKVKEFKLEVPIRVSFEACSSEKCLPPSSQSFKVSVDLDSRSRAERDE